jgi:acyl dehydratase
MTTIATGVEELKALAGTDLGATAWHEISQERVDTFADATDDHQWIHVDPERARSGPFGGTIAHGYLTLSLIIPLFNELLEIRGTSMSVNYGLEKVRFPSPVPVGSKIRMRGFVDAVDEVRGNGDKSAVQMAVTFTIEVDGSTKPACVAQALLRHYE